MVCLCVCLCVTCCSSEVTMETPTGQGISNEIAVGWEPRWDSTHLEEEAPEGNQNRSPCPIRQVDLGFKSRQEPRSQILGKLALPLPLVPRGSTRRVLSQCLSWPIVEVMTLNLMLTYYILVMLMGASVMQV